MKRRAPLFVVIALGLLLLAWWLLRPSSRSGLGHPVPDQAAAAAGAEPGSAAAGDLPVARLMI